MQQKTVIITAFTAALCTAAFGASAQYQSPSQQALAFATCAGRYQAEENRGGARRPDTSLRHAISLRQRFENLLDATLPDAINHGLSESLATQTRVQAWQLHAHLGNHADYSLDDRRRSRAEERLTRDLESCKALIL